MEPKKYEVKMKFKFLAFSMMTMIGLSAFSAPKTFTKEIDLNKEDTSAEFLALVKPGSLRINGTGAKVNGTLSMSEKSLKGNFVVHLQELKTGISLRDDHMKDKFLEVGKYPDASLTITEMNLPQNPFVSAVKLSGITFKGTLKVHGTESPVDGTADIDSTGPQVIAEVKTKTTIPAHQIEKPSYLGVKVADEIEIQAHLKIKK